MSFVNKIRGWGQKGADAEGDVIEHDRPDVDVDGSRHSVSAGAATDLPLVDIEAASAFDAAKTEAERRHRVRRDAARREA